MKRYVLLIIVLYLVMAGSAFPQGLSIKSAELSLSVGHSSISDKNFTIGAPQSAAPINGAMKLSDGKMYEARVNFYNSKRLGAEVLYGYQYGGVTFNRTTAPASSFGVPLQIHTITLNLLYYPFTDLNSAWRPFVFLGGGATIYRPSSGGQKSARDPLQGNFDTFFETSRGTGIVGVGVKRPITKSIGFRADAGVELTKVPTFGLPESSAQVSATVLPVGGTVHSTRASVGIILNLGR
jgi:hypothetical protein